MRLTNKQKLFIEHYLQCWNATRAAQRAGYKGNLVTLEAMGRENLGKPRIAAAIEKRLEQEAMSANEALHRLADQARFDPANLAEALEQATPPEILRKAAELGASHLIKAVKHTKFGINVEFHDPQKALELIGRHHKLFTDRVEVDANMTVEGEWTVSVEGEEG